MNTKEVFLAAANFLETKTWGTGRYCTTATDEPVNEQDPDAECFCILGAVRRFTNGEEDPYCATLTNVTGYKYVSEWNDQVCRSKTEAVAALRRAAEVSE